MLLKASYFNGKFKSKGIKVFQLVLRGGREIPPPSEKWRGVRSFAGGIFLSGGGNLRRSDFDHSDHFQS